ncbi:hypothetical protein NN561_017032 [Cricetulus griseus]
MSPVLPLHPPGAPLDPKFLFQCITANIICSIVFGERFDYKDGQFLRLLDLFYQTFSIISSLSTQMFEFFSGFLKYFPGSHVQVCKNLQEILDYIGHSVEKHRLNLDPSNPRDFIDTYLLRMEKEKSIPHTEFHHKNLVITVLSLFFAGTETSSTTLRYGFLLMLKYPHVAEKVQKEIDQVIGSNRLPTLDDRTKMPYTEAVIHEIQRFSDLIPIGVPHKVTKDTLFRGYLLPKIRERYGPVFTVHLGPRRRIVILCGQEAVKEALVDHALEFSGRGENATFDWLFKGYGVAFSPWERSKPLRRFSIATLRDFGMGKRGIEERIQEEADYLLEALQKTNGALIDPTFYLSRTVSNVMSSIVFGNRFDYEDKEFLSLLKMMTESFQFTASSTGQLYEMFSSVMKHLPGPQQKAFKELQGLEDFITKKVEQHQSTLDSNSPRDFIDSFLIHMQAVKPGDREHDGRFKAIEDEIRLTEKGVHRTTHGSTHYNHCSTTVFRTLVPYPQEEKKNPNTEFYMKNLVLTTLNLFFAGTETVSTTLRYGFLLLMKHPDVEAKIHEEINQVIGRNRQPKYEDRMKMPYTEAVIHEIQRFADLIPMGLPRRVTKDTKFRDFLIPKGTEVFPMLGSVLNDPKFFSNPKDFNPKHFLDDNGQFKKNDAFIPFSLGKRNCFGEGLARMELFLFLTNILQNFHLRSSQAPRDIDVSPKMVGFGTIPPNYTMSFLSH